MKSLKLTIEEVGTDRAFSVQFDTEADNLVLAQTVLQAIAKVPKPKAKRCDAGVPRKPQTEATTSGV